MQHYLTTEDRVKLYLLKRTESTALNLTDFTHSTGKEGLRNRGFGKIQNFIHFNPLIKKFIFVN